MIYQKFQGIAPQNVMSTIQNCLFLLNLHDSQRIVQEMNEDLLQVGNWCFRNRLLLNPDKTKLIVFGSRQMTSKLHEFHLSL